MCIICAYYVDNTEKSVTIKGKEVVKVAYSERELLARIVQCEAGRRTETME